MSLIDLNDGQPYTCFGHGIGYGADGFMCPVCEYDICDERDKHEQQLEEENDAV